MILTLALNIVYLAAIGLSLYMAGWLILKADRNRVTGALAACQILMMVWCIPQLFTSLPMTIGMKYVTYGISYMGISFIGPAWLMFACLYSKKRIKGSLVCLIFAIATINYALFWCNEYHHLFYTVFELEQVVYGPLFFFHMIYTYICVLAGMAVVLTDFRKRDIPVKHILVIVLSAAVPLGFNLLYISGIVQTGFDLTPPAFALSNILMLLAVFRYDLLNVNTMAFQQLFDSIAEGVVIYNGNEVITYCNETAKNWVGAKQGDRIGPLLQELEDEDSQGIYTPADSNMKIEVRKYLYRDKKNRVEAGTILLTDVGKYFELLEQSRELGISNQKLAIEQERNRIAQDVHDTTGHTLTMIQSLLKLMSVSSKETKWENPDSFQEYLTQAQELAGSGIRQLRCSINQMRETASCELVTQGVYQLAGQVKEIQVEVEIQGKDSPGYSHLSAIVYSCMREAITNCLRYGNATHMDVILKFLPRGLNLYVFDNGQGCDEIIEGNGIYGIRQRVEQAGGKVRFQSEKGSGFQIFIQLPI